MIRAYLVDDERLAIERLTRLLGATGRVTVVGSATDPEAALAFLRRTPVDVLFLDIQMPGLTGFELLERLDRDVTVVFTTAYDRYAIDAFGVNSVDYLLKPIEPERLDRALDKLERFAGQARPDVRALARELAAALAPNRRLERIASRVASGRSCSTWRGSATSRRRTSSPSRPSTGTSMWWTTRWRSSKRSSTRGGSRASTARRSSTSGSSRRCFRRWTAACSCG
jgi:YesN/AraC family two-component response regulator